MCGLVGAMGYIGPKEKKAVRQLLQVDTLRGVHSTGLATLDHLGNRGVFKKAMAAGDFLDLKAVDKILLKNLNCVIGHNRYATQGAVNNTNAHPFEFSGIMGAHNGTLTQYYKLDNHSQFEVDSECMLSHINDNGIQDAFDKVTGALALTWYDEKAKQLYFLRNSQRPLYYCFSKDLKTLFWASEYWMLDGILWRNGIEATNIVYTTEDTLYSFDVPQGFVTNNSKLKIPTVKRLVKKVEPVKKLQYGQQKTGSNAALACIKGGKAANYDLKTMHEYVGTEVLMYVNRVNVLDDNNQEYIECALEEDASIDIRVYAGSPSRLKTLMQDSVNSFKCTIKSLTHHNRVAYLLADLRTVEEVPYNLGNEAHITVNGYNGEKLTFKEFTQATSEGCCWCTGNAEFGKPTKFINTFDFFCHTCLKDDGCKEYLEGTGK